MAKVKIQGHASGTGILTVTAPNTSTDRTITLPDATGTLLNSDGDGSSLTGISTPITALNSATANELVTVGATTTELDAEANLTFDGNQLVVTGTSTPSFSATKTDSGTTGHGETASFARTTSGDMADTYGGAIQLKLGDSGSVATGVCAIDWEREGEDNSGKLFLYTRNAGTWNASLAITKDGRGLSQFTAKAWCKFSNSQVIEDSHNVSSVADTAVGKYQINFSNDMGNANYALAGMAETAGNASDWARNVAYVQIATNATSGSYTDYWSSVIVFGD